MNTTYTEKQVIEMLTKERERCIRISEAFMKKYERKSDEYESIDETLKYIAKEQSEVARKISISIDGRTLGLEPKLSNQIKRDYFLDGEVSDEDI